MIPCYQCGQENAPDAAACPACHALLAVAGYRIAGILGQGGCGAVYAAQVLGPGAGRGALAVGERVALKQNFDPAGLLQLQREFAVLGGLQHPGLPRYYDLFEDGANAYLVMELIPGQNLDDVLARHPAGLVEPQVLGYALQLCAVLGYLHGQQPPILHRDVKPANIRVTPEGLIKLVDFGLLKQMGQQTRYSIRGLGTVAYAPLEQYGGGGTDARTDIYSLGATLYHLLTGHRPEDAITRAATSHDPLLPPDHYRPGLTPQVGLALLRALSIRPEDRFADVVQLRAALLGLAPGAANSPRGGAPARPLPDGAPPRPLPDQPTRQLLDGAAAPPLSPPVTINATVRRVILSPVLVETVTFAPSGQLLALGQADGTVRLVPVAPGGVARSLTGPVMPIKSLIFAPNQGPLVAADASGTIWCWRLSDGVLLHKLRWAGEPLRSVAVAPDGTMFASVDLYNQPQLWRVANGQPVARGVGLVSPGHRPVILAFAPDGQTVATGAADGMVGLWQVGTGRFLHVFPIPIFVMYIVRLWQVGTGRFLHVLHSNPGFVHSLAFTPDGSILAAGFDDHQVRLWRLTDNTLLGTLAGHTSGVISLAFTADGAVLASGSRDRTVRLWRVADGALLCTLTGHTDAVNSLAFAPDGQRLASAAGDRTVRLWTILYWKDLPIR